MTIIKPGDSTEGLIVTPEVSAELDNSQISAETLDLLGKVIKIFEQLSEDDCSESLSEEDRKELEKHGMLDDVVADKLSIGYYLEMISQELQNDKNLLAARLLGIIEVDEKSEEIMSGFYIFFPIMPTNTVREIMKLEKLSKDVYEGVSVFCAYVSYNGATALKVFEYPFEGKKYEDLIKCFQRGDLDDSSDINRLAEISERVLYHIRINDFCEDSQTGEFDPYIRRVPKDRIDDYPEQLRLSF